MKQGTCKLCQKVGDLRDSHIIPEFLYKPLYDDEGHSAVKLRVSQKVRGVLRRGIREPLLCGACEQFLNDELEQPFVSLWRDGDLLPKKIEPKQVHISVQLDYRRTKLFLLSVLWRASVASDPTWREVDLGARHNEELRRRILNLQVGGVEDYPVGGYVSTHEGSIWQMIGSPISWKLEGHRIYSFAFGGFEWQFVVSSHRFRPHEIIALQPHGPHRFLGVAVTDLWAIKRYRETWKDAVHPAERAARTKEHGR